VGLFDRIAGTLEGIGGSDALDDEIASARALADAGGQAAAEARLEELAARAPRAAAVLLALGDLKRGRGALEDAVDVYGRAVDAEPGNAEAWTSLGETLAALDRGEPARDALRRALTLAFDPQQRARAHAALGHVHMGGGRFAQAERELRKAADTAPSARLTGAALAAIERDLGRTLAKLGEPEASEWLTRAARSAGADPRLFAEAAAAAREPRRAEALLREGLARAPSDTTLATALVRHLVGSERSPEAIALASSTCRDAPDDPRVWAALREASAAAGDWALAVRAAAMETELGAPPPLAGRVAIALGAEDRAALGRIAADGAASADDAIIAAALAAFVAGRAREEELMVLGRIAPSEAARCFVARSGAPTSSPPDGQLAGLLAWAYDLAARTPELAPLSAAIGRAADALDRPLLVAVMGEFNAGKSSFVNALAGEDIAPTGVTPTTATVNVLRYGATPEARVVHQDGSSRAVAPDSLSAFLAALDVDGAGDVRVVEIFLPVEALRRIEIVDTPGLNSIRPEHERVAREFLRDADAIVWVLAAGQAAKATEKAALETARAAGKRVLGVLNKVDRLEANEVAPLLRHVRVSLGELIDPVLAFSATAALADRRAGRPSSDLDALNAALERRFFASARELKRETAISALRRFVSDARSIADAAAPERHDVSGAEAAAAALAQKLGTVVDGERVGLRSRLGGELRRTAVEVRELLQPRTWPFGERRTNSDDEDLLVELLEDAIGRAVAVSRAAFAAVLDEAPADDAAIVRELAPVRAASALAIENAFDRFAAFARGTVAAGAVPDLVRHDLPRLRPELPAIAERLARRAPDVEAPLFAPLKRSLNAVFRRAHHTFAAARFDDAIRAAIHDERLKRPLDALSRASESVGCGI
jgi:tetratricopeptide (TPR) repeat protein